MATIALPRQPERAWLRWLAFAALVLVVLQGILGGLRVILLEQTLAIVHAATAQAFFALTVGLAVFTSKEWLGLPEATESLNDGGRLRRLCLATTALIYIQVIIGAVLEGPVVGLILGFIFGMTSFLLDTSGLFTNPLVAILPRMMIGVAASRRIRCTICRPSTSGRPRSRSTRSGRRASQRSVAVRPSGASTIR